MNGKNLQELIKNLQVFYKCPSCGSNYQHEDITFLGRVDEHCFMQLTCVECSLPILATVLLGSNLEKQAKLERQARYTPKVGRSDLVRGEKKRFDKKEPITSQEIIDLHIYLNNNSVDIQSLF
ncbi:MAG: hypothetical protein WCH00_00635 [Candidatus Saccharibacteria bacterium]